MYVALIPFLACLLRTGLLFLGVPCLGAFEMLLVPSIAAVLYLLLSIRRDLTRAVTVNAIALTVLTVLFAILMAVNSGNMARPVFWAGILAVLPLLPEFLVFSARTG